MKSNYSLTACLRQLGRATSASALLLLGLTATGQVVPKSPLGTWDCVMSGPRQGLAQISFFDDGTFTNLEILVLRPAQVSSALTNPRGPGGSLGRGPGLGGNTNSSTLPPHTDIFGWESAGGPWGFDNRGRVIGYWYEITQPTLVTNTLQIGSTTGQQSTPVEMFGTTNASGFCITAPSGTSINLDGSTNYLFTYTCYSNSVTTTAITNAISFVATVVPGKRLTLVGSSPAGRVTFQGVADAPMPDLTGSWYGSKHAGLLWYNEFFTLTPSALGPNIYDVQGSGPTYEYWGEAFYFPQKKMAITLGIYPIFPVGADPSQPAPVLRAETGPLNALTFGGTLRGLEGAGTEQADQFFNFMLQKQ